MQTLLDTVFSLFIGGLVLISLNKVNLNLINAADSKGVNTVVQQNMSVMTDVLEYDLRKVGYNNFSAPNFKWAESTRVYIRADFDNDGDVDSVHYYLGSSPDLSNINTRARILYRSYNGSPGFPIRMGVTRLLFRYFDRNGAPLPASPGVADPARIRSVIVSMEMAVGSTVVNFRRPNGTVGQDTTFSVSSWQKMMTPVNLK